MDAIARKKKDDLFDDSSMTFGEHLEELRGSLVKAILWLALGLLVGLLFANSVIRYIQEPLKAAIIEYRADRDLAKLGWDAELPENAALRSFLMQNALVAELVYDLPVPDDVEATLPGVVEPVTPDVMPAPVMPAPVMPATVMPATVMPVDVLRAMGDAPDVSTLRPRLQLRRSEEGLSALKVEEPFMIWVKAGLIVGALIASPMIFYHLWSFVAAGLHAHERQYVYVYLPFSVFLFVAGVLLAFGVVLQYVLQFLLTFNGSMDVAVEPRLTYYVNFVLLLPLGFGIAFQLPLVMLFLQRIDLIQTEDYAKSWRVATVVIFFISMVVTPADVTSMIALAIPLLFLYFLGILLCMYMPRGRGLGSAAYDPA